MRKPAYRSPRWALGGLVLSFFACGPAPAAGSEEPSPAPAPFDAGSVFEAFVDLGPHPLAALQRTAQGRKLALK